MKQKEKRVECHIPYLGHCELHLSLIYGFESSCREHFEIGIPNLVCGRILEFGVLMPLGMVESQVLLDIFQLHLTLRFVRQRRLTLDII